MVHTISQYTIAKFWHKKPFSICFVHKSRKFSNFEPTFDYIMLRNFRTVRPIFPKIASKVAQTSKKKVMKARVAKKKFREIIARNVEGGGGRIPPPALLGLKKISCSSPTIISGLLAYY